MNRKKIMALILSVIMVLGSFTISFAQTDLEIKNDGVSTFKDIKGHWAANAINKWSDYGIINGYNGSFRPNDSITRGEMAVILNNMMDYQVAAQNKFTDLKSGRFYTDAILKANAAGIIKGDGSTVRPTDKITREEAAVMLAKAFALDVSTGGISFNDSASIATWASGYIKTMEAKGYVKGTNNNFMPKSNITRAETVTIIDNIVKAYYTKAGTDTDNVNGIAVIKVSDVILKDITISENLIIAEGVGEGEVTLDSVTVKGKTVVRGGGENSIHI
ncbi:S-layer homology domain-containing protein [Natronincola peptidivorans]|uniref:S-layer homology domain-containing protein n=1 Tax=Natronincola peptidivorans TaxID=426128 RepID=A0A1I0GG13_9FIRM|nr:S-layer homology domain-containing protein [Natronincola peptidivorans]SET70055.1 S-layer homology domain-containing protein [Natronincola peptidivorans]